MHDYPMSGSMPRNIWHRISSLRRLAGDQRGASAIEFAIVAPVFLLFVIGVVFYGTYFAVAHNVQQLTAEAARATVAGINSAERQALASQTVSSSIASYAFLRADKLSVSVSAVAPENNLHKVTAVYDATHLGLWSLQGIVPLPSSTVKREAVIRRGGY